MDDVARVEDEKAAQSQTWNQTLVGWLGQTNFGQGPRKLFGLGVKMTREAQSQT